MLSLCWKRRESALVGRQAGWQARQTGRRARLGVRRGGSSGRRSWLAGRLAGSKAGRQGWIEGGWCRAGSGDCPPGTPCRTLAVPPLPQVQNLRPFYRCGLGPGPRGGSRLLIGCWSFSNIYKNWAPIFERDAETRRGCLCKRETENGKTETEESEVRQM